MVRKRSLLIVAGAAPPVLLLAIACFTVTQPVLWVSEVPTSPSVDPRRLEAHVRVLAEDLIPRDWTHPENLDRAAAYIRQEFEASGGRVREQVYGMEGKTYRNVIADFGPESRQLIVVGAHYDAAGEFPGADDNASGVSGLIELAHALWKVGYDAVMVTDTALYRNGNYHASRDTPGTLDYVRMAQVVRGVSAAVQAIGAN